MEMGIRKGSSYRSPPGMCRHWMLPGGGKSGLLGPDNEKK